MDFSPSACWDCPAPLGGYVIGLLLLASLELVLGWVSRGARAPALSLVLSAAWWVGLLVAVAFFAFAVRDGIDLRWARADYAFVVSRAWSWALGLLALAAPAIPWLVRKAKFGLSSL